MAPTFNLGKSNRWNQNKIVDARQIIQRKEITNQARSQKDSNFRNTKMAERLGFKTRRNSYQFRSGAINKFNSNLAGRIGNVRQPYQSNFQRRFNAASQQYKITDTSSQRSKQVLFLGKKLLVTAKQATIKPMVSSSNRRAIKQESLQGLESYLKLISPSPKWVQSPTGRANTTRSSSILVSNLHPSVTESDIIELFGDVGEIHNAKLQHPGAAVIVYQRSEDATKACQIYHNRLLDDQPMQCSLLGLSQSTPGIASRLGGKVQNVISESNFSPSPSLFHNDEVVKKLLHHEKIIQSQREEQQKAHPARRHGGNVIFTVQIP